MYTTAFIIKTCCANNEQTAIWAVYTVDANQGSFEHTTVYTEIKVNKIE